MNPNIEKFYSVPGFPDSAAQQPSIDPLEKEDRTNEQQAFFEFLESVSSGGTNELSSVAPVNILGTIAHHPALLDVFIPLATQLGSGSKLAKPDLEILALRTAYRAASLYEWVHHVDYALDAGLSQAAIDSLLEERPSYAWTSLESLLIRTADQLTTQPALDSGTLAQLLTHFTPDLVVEIIFVVNQYNSLSKFANSLGVQLEERYFEQ